MLGILIGNFLYMYQDYYLYNKQLNNLKNHLQKWKEIALDFLDIFLIGNKSSAKFGVKFSQVLVFVRQIVLEINEEITQLARTLTDMRAYLHYLFFILSIKPV